MPLIRKYPSRVVALENPLEGLYVLTLESMIRAYNYLPGQFLHLALDPYDPSAPWPESRCFSPQTASLKKTLQLTFAVKGGFTQRMARELVPGHEIVVKLPYGDLFSRGHETANCVFIAGGTGVTPFLSLFAAPEFGAYRDPVLWLGVREARYNLYQAELETAREQNPGFDFNLVNQERDGMLEIEKIFAKHGLEASYFISGPPAMIKAFKAYLVKTGLPNERVLTDDWE